MKKIEAIIKPFLLDDLYEALLERGFVAMTVSEIRSYQEHPGRSMIHQDRIVPIEVDFSSRLKIELVVNDEDVDVAAAIFQTSAQLADNSLRIQDVEDVIRIRTNEHGAIAV